jgi:Flp pilus assembly protein TadD
MKRVALFASLALCAPLVLSGQEDGHDAFRTGKYQEAITLLSKVPPTDSEWVAAQRDLARTYATIGKYDEAENAARRAISAKGGKDLWNTLGEILLLRGKRAAAESAFVRA